LRAHVSQTSVLVDAVGEADFRRWWQAESFVAAAASQPAVPGYPAVR